MRTLNTIIITTLFILCQNAVSQTFWDRVSIRKAFESKTIDDDKAAIISMTSPEEGDDIFKVNAGIGYTFGKLGVLQNHSFSLFFVYNKNNQLDKEQENYKSGLSYSYQYSFNANFALLNDYALEYLNDNTKKTRSLLVLTYFHLHSNREGNLKLDSYGLTPGIFAYQFNPKIGLEYQNDFDKEAPLESGYYLRSYFNVGGKIKLKKKTMLQTQTITQKVDNAGQNIGAPVIVQNEIELDKKFWKKGFEISVNYEGRNILSDNYDDNPNYLYFFKGEARCYPIADDNFSLGLSYNKGEDPISGLDKQEFWMLSLSFKK